MVNIGKKIIVLVLSVVLSFSINVLAASVQAAEPYSGTSPSAEAMFMDGVVIRPLGIVATILGGAVFIVTLPFSALGGNVGEASQMLVVNPVKMTFQRPLGEFD